MFASAQALPRTDRSSTNGFRCVKRAAPPAAAPTLAGVDFLASGGRALLFPIYQGSYERGTGPRMDPWNASRDAWRDFVIRSALDLGRSIDYRHVLLDTGHSDPPGIR
jgi:hypothetical protein